MTYLGDFAVGATVSFKFTTRRFTTGAPFTLAGSPAVKVYKTGSDVEDDSGITLTADYDTKTGLNHVSIDTSADGTFYAAGSDCQVFISAGTVDSVSVVGEVVAHFSIANRPLQSIGASVITATSIATDAIGAAELADGAITAATFAAGAITATVIATDAIDDDALSADAVTAIQSGLATAAALTTVSNLIDTEVAAILTDTNELQTDWTNGGRLDLLVDAIKAKTDSLTFTVAGQADANVQYVNDVQVIGTGATGDEWGPA